MTEIDRTKGIDSPDDHEVGVQGAGLSAFSLENSGNWPGSGFRRPGPVGVASQQPPRATLISVERNRLELSVVSSLEVFNAMGEEWDALVRSMDQPPAYLLHGWLTTWWRHFGSGALQVIVARRGSIMVGAIPLMVRKVSGLRVIEFVGGQEARYGDLIIARDEEPAVVQALAEALHALPHDLADLTYMTQDSRILSLMRAGRIRVRETTPAPRIDCSRGWDAVYREKFSSKTRHTHRRKRRMLSEFGRVEFVKSTAADELSEALEEAFVLHLKRFESLRDQSNFVAESHREFQHEIIRALSASNCARIMTLRVSGRPVAFAYYFVVSSYMYYHRIGFDPSFAHFSPGLLTTLTTFEDACGEGVQHVRLGRGELSWKKMFADDDGDVAYRALGFPKGLKGSLALSLSDARLGLKRMLGIR